MSPSFDAPLVLATTNRHKMDEFAAWLVPAGVPYQTLADFPPIPPYLEEGATLADNARAKARDYALRLGRWVLADDTGLEVDALNGEPGVRTARYAGDAATMAENREKLLAELRHVAPEERTARFVCWLVLADPKGESVWEAVGCCPGRVRVEPAGTGGFGYDVLFEVCAVGRTLAELDVEETARHGHRGRAMSQFVAEGLSRFRSRASGGW